ncbi:MAG: sodium:proton antiporter [Atopobiaceae bacterium]|nr:sodium:proton antiporter [Atopobiaceae bacterium]
MTELIVLGAFAVMLIVGTVLSFPLVGTLSIGFVLFFGYGLYRGFSAKSLLLAAGKSIWSVKTIIFLFVIVGAMSAAWRASGTIPEIVSISSALISPSIFILATFLLCTMMSMLLGTAFGTAATMGIICMSIGKAIGASDFFIGGAVLAGSYFGDRCSPMSTSAILVSQLTDTNLSKNISRMIRTSVIPFIAACLIYVAWDLFMTSAGTIPDVTGLLSRAFRLSWVSLAPAILVIVFSLLKINVTVTMSTSLILACILCVTVQNVPIGSLPQILLFGLRAPGATVAKMVNGGGVFSMTNVVAIVTISSSYAGLFQTSGLLRRMCQMVAELSDNSTPFLGVLITSMFTSMVSCNQTLAIMLTNDLCESAENSSNALALDIENSAVILAPLVPWSISNISVLSAIGAPSMSLLAASFLYLLPLWTLGISVWIHHRPTKIDGHRARWLGLTQDDVRACTWSQHTDCDSTATASVA